MRLSGHPRTDPLCGTSAWAGPRHNHDTSRRDDRGSQLLEFAAYFPLLLLTAVLAIEAFLAFVAIERVESAARAGARVAGSQGTAAAETVARDALPDWLEDASIRSAPNDSGGYYTQVSVGLPILFSAADLGISITRRVDMPNV
ncbi:TadE/TadG family type IV pilus assembly protein [Salinactinospora qingdaonensis]|uniref:TadE-like domain-containing protein n=1 Tax=Salinactinospora qingdaonensis TaxID=702744 RepID=A0ABP7EVY5_9ACTN